MKQVMDGLYLGTWQDAIFLEDNIEAVLNLRKFDYKPNRSVVAYAHFSWLYLEDSEHLNKLHNAVQFIIEQHEKLKRNTFIHCQVGLDRTVGVALCYLMHRGLTFKQAEKCINELNLSRSPVREVIEAVHKYNNDYVGTRN